jgi:hypothetical protein
MKIVTGFLLELKEQERQTQKLIGLISKPDILNVAAERKEFEKAVEKLDSTYTK